MQEVQVLFLSGTNQVLNSVLFIFQIAFNNQEQLILLKIYYNSMHT